MSPYFPEAFSPIYLVLTLTEYPSTLLNVSMCGRTNHLSPTTLAVFHLKLPAILARDLSR